jgi:hypothetical protein
VTTVRTQEAIYDFVDTFTILLTVTDKDIDNFVKATHEAIVRTQRKGIMLSPS